LIAWDAMEVVMETGSTLLMRVAGASRDPLDTNITVTSTSKALDVTLGQAKGESRRLDLGLLDPQGEDEGEIMLLAMILLQLHGVKLPTSASPQSEDAASANKKKRQRTSPEQLAILEQIFQTDKMPNQQTRIQLADQLGMSSRRVQIWFQNKRAKVKRGSSRHDGSSPGSPDASPSASPQLSARRNSNSSTPSDSPILSSSSCQPITPLVSSQGTILSPSSSCSSSLSSAVPKLSPSLGTSKPTPSQTQPSSFTTKQIQFSLSGFDSLLPNDYSSLRLQTLLKN